MYNLSIERIWKEMKELKGRKGYLQSKKKIPLCEGDVHKYHLCGDSWVKDVHNKDNEVIARIEYTKFVCERCGHTKYIPLQFDDKSNPDD